MSQNTIINVNGISKNTIPWININNTWVKCIPWVNVSGVWKKCYNDNTYTMTIYIPSSGDSELQSQSRTVSIPGLQSVVNCTVNTGTVSYTISGTDVTINVNNGNSVRSYTPSKTTTDIRQTSPGGDPATLPSSISYNSSGYSGTLAGGSAYVYSGSPAGSKYCTGTAGDTIIVVDGEIVAGTIPGYIPYNDGEYSGNLDPIGVNSAYINNYNAFLDAMLNDTSWSGYILYDYGATLSKSDTRVWQKDYSGTVYGATINYYAYIVTLIYVIN